MCDFYLKSPSNIVQELNIEFFELTFNEFECFPAGILHDSFQKVEEIDYVLFRDVLLILWGYSSEELLLRLLDEANTFPRPAVLDFDNFGLELRDSSLHLRAILAMKRRRHLLYLIRSTNHNYTVGG